MTGRFLDCGCYIDEAGKRTWCPTCAEGAGLNHTADPVPLAAAARRLDRYSETPGLGLFKDALGGWLRRADVLALVDGLDVLREGGKA